MQCGPMSPHVTGTPEFGGLGEGWWDGNRADPEQCSPNTNKRSATPNKCSDLPNKCSGTKHQEPNTWYQEPGPWYLVPDTCTRYLVPGTRYSTRTSVQVFRTSVQVFRTPNTEHEHRTVRTVFSISPDSQRLRLKSMNCSKRLGGAMDSGSRRSRIQVAVDCSRGKNCGCAA